MMQSQVGSEADNKGGLRDLRNRIRDDFPDEALDEHHLRTTSMKGPPSLYITPTNAGHPYVRRPSN